LHGGIVSGGEKAAKGKERVAGAVGDAEMAQKKHRNGRECVGETCRKVGKMGKIGGLG